MACTPQALLCCALCAVLTLVALLFVFISFFGLSPSLSSLREWREGAAVPSRGGTASDDEEKRGAEQACAGVPLRVASICACAVLGLCSHCAALRAACNLIATVSLTARDEQGEEKMRVSAPAHSPCLCLAPVLCLICAAARTIPLAHRA